MSLRCQALVAEKSDAEELHSAGIEHMQRTLMIPELGRAHLLYGEWLRGHGRLRDARAQLASAYDLFASIGAHGFAGRAQTGLLAVGGRPAGTGQRRRDELTPRERQIARLAGDGLSNEEIAEQLFLSVATIAYHLTKVFRKLGVSNRTLLQGVLDEGPRGGEPG